jgi:cobalt-precorrin-5B (C1)-methyltransferase
MLPTYKQPDGTILRAGVTTGTCAACAAKAAVTLLYNLQDIDAVELDTPAGFRVSLPLEICQRRAGWAKAGVRKFAGDDPDVTDKVLVIAEARKLPTGEIRLSGGEGVGRVTKPGLALPPGEWAINPEPRKQIRSAVQSVLPEGQGVEIIISIPGGAELARRTLNPELGIVGGISILGTTGIVEPMSSDAFKRSLIPQIDVALAMGQRTLILTPGKMGKRNALTRFAMTPEAVVVTSNFIGYMLKACAAKGVEGALLFGHVGKLCKVAAGITDTHSKVADARREVLVAHSALQGLPLVALTDLMHHNTAEESAAYLVENQWGNVLNAVAEAAARRAEVMADRKLWVGCIMLNLAGEMLACDRQAKQWLEERNEV